MVELHMVISWLIYSSCGRTVDHMELYVLLWYYIIIQFWINSHTFPVLGAIERQIINILMDSMHVDIV